MRLALRDIGYTYAQGTSFAVRALSGVGLEVDRGELVLVLGATGSGKSTLLRIAAGLLSPAEGTVMLDGAPVSRPSEIIGRVGLVFQSPQSQLFAETVEDDVAFGPRNLGSGHDAALEAAREALERVGLDWRTFGQRSPFALSGGEAHRVAIAGVLAMRPEIVLFDEPTTGLDVNGRRAVRAIVEELRERAGVAIVSHDVEEFLGVADRVIVLSEGVLAYSGGAGALIEEPARFQVAGLRVPEVLRAQVMAREAGVPMTCFSLDPHAAAALVAGARERKRERERKR